jgi:proteasome component ECM29
MLGLFFDNLELEQKNVRTYVQDALSSMIEIYVNIAEDSPIYQDLQNIILKAVQKVRKVMHEKKREKNNNPRVYF